jgi:hypothetical protein
VAGATTSFAGGAPWVLKLDGNGNVVWQKIYSSGIGESIQQTSDGGYIVAGETQYFADNYEAWVLKLDGSGNVQWQKTYDALGYQYPFSIQQTSDDGYIMAGEFAGYDAWVLKLDGNGNINDCSIVRIPNAQVSDIYTTVQDTNAIVADSNVSPQTSSASVSNANAIVTEVCYGPLRIGYSPTSFSFSAIQGGSTPPLIRL